jgi:hypothetical protein
MKMTGCAAVLLVDMLSMMSFPLWAADGIIAKVPDPSGAYCHLRFPAITEGTLFSDHPVLKDPSEGDIRDFYGPCNYDPSGKEETERQRKDHQRERRRRYGSD